MGKLDALTELWSVYARVDEMMAPFSCPGQYRMLPVRAHRPRAVPDPSRRRSAARSDGPRRPPARTLPRRVLGHGRLRFSPGCPAFAPCTRVRPYGCRTFFCEDREGPKAFPRQRGEPARAGARWSFPRGQRFPREREAPGRCAGCSRGRAQFGSEVRRQDLLGWAAHAAFALARTGAETGSPRRSGASARPARRDPPGGPLRPRLRARARRRRRADEPPSGGDRGRPDLRAPRRPRARRARSR